MEDTRQITVPRCIRFPADVSDVLDRLLALRPEMTLTALVVSAVREKYCQKAEPAEMEVTR